MNIKITERIRLTAHMAGKETGYSCAIVWRTKKSYVMDAADYAVGKYPPDPFLVMHIRGFCLFGLNVMLRIREKGFSGVTA